MTAGLLAAALVVGAAPAALGTDTCGGFDVTLAGTSGNDRLEGTPGIDVIAGYAGDDILIGLGGDDVLCGGPGADTLRGGTGDDLLMGNGQDDILDGGAGDDHLNGGKGADILYGRNNEDTLIGGKHDDLLLGGKGDDLLKGGPGRDDLCGEENTDDLRGGDHPDYLLGGFGPTDLAHGGKGTDYCEAESERKCEGGPPPVPTLRIAIVAPSAANDLSHTQAMVDAAEYVTANRCRIDVDITDGEFVVEDAAQTLRAYAAAGTDLVIAHGSQYGGALQDIAPDYPDVTFAWGTASDTFGLPNLYSYEAASDEGAYVMGVIAALVSDTGTVGVVGPIEVGDSKLYVDGFRLGAESEGADPRITYTGSFSNVALAYAAAQAFAAQGVDAMTATSQMFVGALTVASDEGMLWFGNHTDQASLDESIVVASQVYRWEIVLNRIIDRVRADQRADRQYTIDLGNRGLRLVYNDTFDLPPGVRAIADATVAGIIAGDIPTRP